MQTVLITGVSGLLGSNLAWCMKERFHVHGVYNAHPVRISGVVTRPLDVLSSGSVRQTIESVRPDIVIHCASLANVDLCEKYPDEARRIHVEGTASIVEALRGTDTQLIYVSSDSVYEGIQGPYAEDEGVAPRNVYGRTKLEGEKAAAVHPDHLILRTNIFGWNIQEKASLAEWILHELMAGRSVNGFQDARFSCIYTFELARLIELAISKKLAGVYNCGVSTPCSKYEFALQLAAIFDLGTDLVKPALLKDAALAARRGQDLSMDVSLFERAVGEPMPSTNACLTSFYRDFRGDIRHKLRYGAKTPKPSTFHIPYGWHDIDPSDIEAVVDVLQSGNLTQGPRVKAFEDALCAATDAKYSIAVNSGTSALHMAGLAAGVGPGDQVITSPVTFVASANCAVYCGARPVFVDIDPKTWNMDPDKLKEAINPKTRAIIPVHFTGQSCDMQKIHSIVRDAEKKFGQRICIIEDASHALGSVYRKKPVGACTWSDMTVMSFHPVKHITTGEGGAILTQCEKLAGSLRRLRSHGIVNAPAELIQKAPGPWYYEQQSLGFNYRITDIQCALGLSQLRRLPEFIRRRKEIVERYNKAFQGLKNITVPFESGEYNGNRHLYVLLFDFLAIEKSRVEVMSELKRRGIGSQVHYIPVHTQPYYKERFATGWGDFPCAEAYYEKCLSIPLYPAMSDADVETVIQAIKEIVS